MNAGKRRAGDLLGELPGRRLLPIRRFHHLPNLRDLPWSCARKVVPALVALSVSPTLSILAVSNGGRAEIVEESRQEEELAGERWCGSLS